MTTMSIRILSARDIRRALPMGEAVAAMKEAFTELSAGRVNMPARAHIDVAAHGGTALFMPSQADRFGKIGLKVVNLFDGNAAKGLPRIQGLVCLFDGATGSPLAVLDGTCLTALRTGAASGTATDLLARPEAATVAIFGAGVQARTQLEAVCAVRPIRRGRVFDPAADAAATFATEMGETLGIDVTVAPSPRDALQGADVVCAATVSPTPVFADADLAPGAHINAVGSYKPDVQEIPEETVLRALLIVDHRESALAETGDLIIPIEKGLMQASDIHAELGEIAAGKASGRTSESQITLFKSVGVAIQDLAAAAHAFESAKHQGLGEIVEM